MSDIPPPMIEGLKGCKGTREQGKVRQDEDGRKDGRQEGAV